MDEIAYNAINTDASFQIDILLSDATFKTGLKEPSNKTEDCTTTKAANIEKTFHTNVDSKWRVEDVFFNGKKGMVNLKEDRNEFCSVVGNDNKMGADVKGNPFVRF